MLSRISVCLTRGERNENQCQAGVVALPQKNLLFHRLLLRPKQNAFYNVENVEKLVGKLRENMIRRNVKGDIVFELNNASKQCGQVRGWVFVNSSGHTPQQNF